MYLSRLEVSGFKSFAQRTKFEFGNGIAAVVGPNGCGKTNVVDAIRWVLGEQKTSVLRSDLMENVIFNGTKSRKPVSMAEVSLTLQNNKRILPTEYDEVTISRRLFRSGDSQYMINKSKCRLRDITELFMDTGMGSDSYSVIELKMVESILSGKPEERRHLFEEAAGVNKYKQRRKEAGRKLLNVETDLLRVEDIVAEIQKNVNSLSRQAAKTRRYNKLLEELKEVELSLLKQEYYIINNSMGEVSGKIQNMKSERNSTKEKLDELEIATDNLKNGRSEIETEYRAAKDSLDSLKSTVAAKEQYMAVTKEKLNNIIKNRELLGIESKKNDENIEEQKTLLESTEEELYEIVKKREASESILKEKKDKSGEALRILKNLRETSDEKNRNILNLRGSLNTIRDLKERNGYRKKVLSEKIDEYQSELQRNLEQVSREETELEEILATNNDIKERLEDAELEYSKAQELRFTLQSDIDNKHNEILELNNKYSGKKSSLEFLEGLFDTAESSLFLKKSDKWAPADKTILSEQVGVDDDYRVAVGAALGSLAGYFIVDTRSEAESAFNLLKNENKGKAGIIVKEEIPDVPEPAKINTEDGIAGRVSELVRTGGKLRNLLRLYLGDTVLVDSEASALNALKQKNIEAAVTPDGSIYTKKGIYKSGSISKEEGKTIGKAERTSKLRKEIAKLEIELESSKKSYEDLKNQYNSIDLNELKNIVKKLENESHQHESAKSGINRKIDMLSDKNELISNSIESSTKEIENLESENKSFDENSAKLEKDIETAIKLHDTSLEELQYAEENYSELQDNEREAELSDLQLMNNLNYKKEEASRIKINISNMIRRGESLLKDIELNDRTMLSRNEEIEATATELEKFNDTEIELKNKVDILSSKLTDLTSQIESFGDEISSLRKLFEKQTESIHELDIKASEYKTRIDSLISKAINDYQVQLDNIIIVRDPEFSVEENKKNVSELKEKLSLLGAVNFMALEEYDETKERLDFYNEQIKDLRDSKDTLTETITEINNTAEEKFRDTYEKIRENFKALFKKLFSVDGDADLIMADGNILEADIEIIAKPPGKKPHSIEMISSGEKTLTAIALLFAIYLVKPSPFCILDEVDAPLDDTNIGRFIGMLKDFSDNTQFLIVTHNKKTMEAADTLYGITMQEEGISKIVSVKLSKAEA